MNKLIRHILAVFSFTKPKPKTKIYRLAFADVCEGVRKVLGCPRLTRYQVNCLSDGWRQLDGPCDSFELRFDDKYDTGLTVACLAYAVSGYGWFDQDNGIPLDWAECCLICFEGEQVCVDGSKLELAA